MQHLTLCPLFFHPTLLIALDLHHWKLRGEGLEINGLQSAIVRQRQRLRNKSESGLKSTNLLPQCEIYNSVPRRPLFPQCFYEGSPFAYTKGCLKAGIHTTAGDSPLQVYDRCDPIIPNPWIVGLLPTKVKLQITPLFTPEMSLKFSFS